MKHHLFIWIIALLLFACGAEKDTAKESKSDQSEVNTPTFSSQKFDVSFRSQLDEETLDQVTSFADQQIGTMTLISLLPDCQIIDGEERCYETTVFSSIKGDSLKSEHLTNLDSVRIDSDRFGVTKTLSQEDIKKLLPVLFSGDKKEAISFCYSPRHAIAIFNPNSRMSGFIEICFECSESIAVFNSIELPDLSEKALNEIGALFMAYGFEEETASR